MAFDPYEAPKQPLEPVNPSPSPGRPGLALGFGIFGLIAWILPIIVLPVTIVGLVQGGKAISGPKKGLALAATMLCAIGLTLSALNMAIGVYLGATGQHALVNQMRGGPPAKAAVK